MSMRVILSRLSGTPTDYDVLCSSLAISRISGGHIVAYFSQPQPRDDTVIIDDFISPSDYEEIISGMEKDWRLRARSAYNAFHHWRGEHNIPCVRDPEAFEGPTAEWHTPVPGASEAAEIARLAKLADLFVSGTQCLRDEALEAALFESGRPVLLVPEHGNPNVVGDNVVVAWNGSVEAAHAVTAAMPLLTRSKHVTVFTSPTGSLQLSSAQEFVVYLKWSGVRASLLAPGPGGANSVSGALLQTAKWVKANLLVMGAYTHSRVRERLFGGVTKDVLSSADLPVFMAH